MTMNATIEGISVRFVYKKKDQRLEKERDIQRMEGEEEEESNFHVFRDYEIQL